ncbi:MAG TPA: nucleotidyltransferase [Elusimicrobia bacterium]|nr:nucleotidyltransferase [Elusimicrobiota bacterium]
MLDLSSLEKACEALDLALKVYDKSAHQEDNPEKVLLRDGVIQRFEFTYELSWKMLKRYLEEYSLEKADGLNNRDLFRIGYEQGLIADPEKWFYYLKMRNQTSHVYDKAKAIEVFAAARFFLPDSQHLLKRLRGKVK